MSQAVLVPEFEVKRSTFVGACYAAIVDVPSNSEASNFPLRGRVHLRSEIKMRFPSNEFLIEPPRVAGELPTIHVAFLSLMGSDGVLPFSLNERILHDDSEGSKAIHAFLDLLNRRFWELFFLAHGVGGNPQYALLNKNSYQVLGDASVGFVGWGPQLSSPEFLENLNGTYWTNQIQRNCLHAWGGTGNIDKLEKILSKMLDAQVKVQRFQPSRLETSQSLSSTLTVGLSGARLGKNTVLGRHAWVACAWLVNVVVSCYDGVRNFLPGNSGFLRISEMLDIFGGNSRGPLTLRVQGPTNASLSQLGCPDMKLGWGARISSQRAASQIVHISASNA